MSFTITPSALEERAVASSRLAIQSFIDRYRGMFMTSQQVVAQARVIDTNAALTDEWTAEGKFFGLRIDSQTVYPAFQFDETGKPHPMLGAILAALRQVPNRNEWGIAVWFGASNGWLGGKEPAQCLANDPDEVLFAAEQDAAHLAS